MLNKIPKNLLPRFNKNSNKQISSFDVNKTICQYQYNDKLSLDRFINNYKSTKKEWEETPFTHKKDIFLKTADLIEVAHTLYG